MQHSAGPKIRRSEHSNFSPSHLQTFLFSHFRIPTSQFRGLSFILWPQFSAGQQRTLFGEFYQPDAPGFCHAPGPNRRDPQYNNTGHPGRCAPGPLEPANLKYARPPPRLLRRELLSKPLCRLSGHLMRQLPIPVCRKFLRIVPGQPARQGFIRWEAYALL